VLWRDLLEGEGTLTAVCLNPSTADENTNDATVSRCIVRAKSMGFRRFEMLNLFAWRSTDPKQLLTVSDPVGPDNDEWILARASESKMIICGWGGTSPLIPERATTVLRELRGAGIKLHALKLTKDGHPGHPLYISYSIKPFDWMTQ
jgi:hypothetical protein